MNTVCLRVVAGLLRRDTSAGPTYLVGRRPRGRYAGRWEFPGGKVESGETDAAALTRELREELGVFVQVGAARAVALFDPAPDGGDPFGISLHDATLSNATEPVAEVHTALAWLTAAEIRALAAAGLTTPSTLPFAAGLT